MFSKDAPIQETRQPVPSWRLVRHWGWVVVLGIILVILGAIGIAMSAGMMLGAVLTAGWFLLISGLLQALHTFSGHPRRSFGLDLLTTVFYTVFGALILSNTILGPSELAVLLSLFFMVVGIFRIIVATVEPIAASVPVLATGIVVLLLGIHLWVDWPTAGLWLIGLYIGIEIAITGWSLIMRGLAERRL